MAQTADEDRDNDALTAQQPCQEEDGETLESEPETATSTEPEQPQTTARPDAPEAELREMIGRAARTLRAAQRNRRPMYQEPKGRFGGRTPLDDLIPWAGLTPQQKRFCEVYLECGDKGKAYRAAYPRAKSPLTWYNDANKLLKDQRILGYIGYLAREAATAAASDIAGVMKHCARIAYADIRELYDRDGKPLPIKDISRDLATVIQAFEHRKNRDGSETWDYKLADRVAAMKLLADIHAAAAKGASDSGTFEFHFHVAGPTIGRPPKPEPIEPGEFEEAAEVVRADQGEPKLSEEIQRQYRRRIFPPRDREKKG